MPVNHQNTVRQSTVWISNSSGTVVDNAPTVPKAKITPLTRGIFALGNHSTFAFSDAIRQADTPRPISPRPTISVTASDPKANSAAPTAATIRSAACTFRGPYRSSTMPSGSCTAAKVMK